jgi:hypothetical protein
MTHETASPDAAEGSLLLGDDRTGPKLFQHGRKGAFTSVVAALLLAYRFGLFTAHCRAISRPPRRRIAQLDQRQEPEASRQLVKDAFRRIST